MMPVGGRPQVSLGPIPSLDGIRAVAVALVFFAHGGLENIVPGGLGVTIFFVLSGFLITTLMRIEHARSGRIGFRSFFQRRLLRLMPPLIIVVGLAGLLSELSIIDGGFSVGGLLAALFYAGNYYVIGHDFRGMPAGLGVVWSLAIEEHYYLFFPPLAALLLRARSIRLSRVTLISLCTVLLAWRCWLVLHGASSAYLAMATDTRVDAILFGCLMALTCNPWLDRRHGSVARSDLPLGVLAITALMMSLLFRDEAFRMTARYTLQSVAVAALIYLAVARASRPPWRWLSARPVAYLGTVSYTVYLSHHVILLGLAKHWPQWGSLRLMAAAAAATLAFAEPMRRWIEQPCARLRQRLHRAAGATRPAPDLMPIGAP